MITKIFIMGITDGIRCHKDCPFLKPLPTTGEHADCTCWLTVRLEKSDESWFRTKKCLQAEAEAKEILTKTNEKNNRPIYDEMIEMKTGDTLSLIHGELLRIPRGWIYRTISDGREIDENYIPEF